MAGTGTGGHGFTINLQKVGSTTILTWYGATITRCGFHGTLQTAIGFHKISQSLEIDPLSEAHLRIATKSSEKVFSKISILMTIRLFSFL